MLQSLAEIADCVRGCTLCELSRTRTRAVPGDGSSRAEIMFIGEGPGWNEDKQGLPFVGAAGQFLNEMLDKIGLNRGEVFVTNVVKCRPPGNRDPLPDEIVACSGYLDGQLAAIQPKVVVTLGRYSMARWFPGERISRIHGQARKFGDLVVVPMYHPAAALHQTSLRAAVEADMLKLPGILDAVRQEQIKAEAVPPSQLKFF